MLIQKTISLPYYHKHVINTKVYKYYFK